MRGSLTSDYRIPVRYGWCRAVEGPKRGGGKAIGAECRVPRARRLAAILLVAGCAWLAGCGGGGGDPDDPDDGGGVTPPGSPLVACGRLCGFLYENPKTRKLEVQPMPAPSSARVAVADAAVRTDAGNLALTGDDGGFSFEGVPAGRRRVEVDPEGLFDNPATLTYEVVVEAGRTSSGEWAPSEPHGALGAAMGFAYEDSGGALVLAPTRRTDMRSLSEAIVLLDGKPVTTDASGGYVSTGLAPGTRQVRSAGASGSRTVTIIAGLTAAGSDATPQPHGAASGYVGLAFDAEEPYLAVAPSRPEVDGIPRAQVVLDSGQRALTGAKGEYCLYGVSPGAHTLTASVRGTGGVASVVLVVADTVSHGLDAPPGSIGSISVSLVPGQAPLNVGRTLRLEAVARDPRGSAITGFNAFDWFVSDAKRARVDHAGLLTGLSPGGITVGASAGSVSGGLGLEVLPPGSGVPARVSLTLTGPRVLEVGTSRRVTVSVYDTDDLLLPGHPVTLASSAPGVATVSGQGTVWAVGAGTCVLTATAADGVTGELPLEVVASSARLTVEPGSLTFSDTGEGYLRISDRLSGYEGLMNWAVSTDQPWLSVVPLVGAGEATLTVRVDAEGLADGSYTGSVVVDAAAYGRREVPVTLNVQDVIIIIE